MGRMVRDIVHLYIVEKINNHWLIGDKYRIIIILDRKQKVLGMRFIEGQVKYSF